MESENNEITMLGGLAAEDFAEFCLEEGAHMFLHEKEMKTFEQAK